MCGRLVVSEPDLSVFVEPFAVQQVDVVEWQPRFNLAPTELAPLITNESGRRLALARFGLVPSWADDSRAGGKWINARVETVAKAKPFRRAFALHRGIVPVNGYFEWRSTPHGKRALYIHDPSGQPLMLAAVWECWHARQGSAAPSFAVLTRPATEAFAEIHSRMPFQLQANDIERWLSPREQSFDDLAPVLGRPADVERLAMRGVSALVNSVKNDSPACIEPHSDDAERAEQRQLQLFESIAGSGPRTLGR